MEIEVINMKKNRAEEYDRPVIREPIAPENEYISQNMPKLRPITSLSEIAVI